MPAIQTPKTIYLFFGEDSYSVTQKQHRWQKEFEKKYGDMNVETFEGKSLSHQTFSTAVDSQPFLSEKKLIIIEDFFRDGKEEEQKKIAEKLEHVQADCIVIFIENEKPDARTALYKRIGKFGTIEEFQVLVGQKLTQWIEQEMKKMGAFIDHSQAQFLADTVGPNLWQMKQELEKLSTYAQEKPITNEIIELLVTPNLSVSIFKFTDYLGQRKIKESLKTLHYLIESGEDVVKIFFMIVRQFRLLIQIADCLEKNMNKNEIIQSMKEHPFVISSTIGQAKNFTPKTLKKIYELLRNIDSDLKKGKIKISTNDNTEFLLALEKLIISIPQG